MKIFAASILSITLFVFVSVLCFKVFETSFCPVAASSTIISTCHEKRSKREAAKVDERTNEPIYNAMSVNSSVLVARPSPTPSPSNRCSSKAVPDPESIYDTGPEDWDCDGVCNRLDNCTLVYNPDQNDKNGDGYGDACDPATVPKDFTDIRCDMDGDGILDSKDNCPGNCNPSQRDSDHNNIGDACDGKNSLGSQ